MEFAHYKCFIIIIIIIIIIACNLKKGAVLKGRQHKKDVRMR